MKYFYLIILTVFTSSCYYPQKKDYASDLSYHPTHPTIIIPGIMGTRLKDPRDGSIVWGKAFDLKATGFHVLPSGSTEDGLELPIDHLDFAENVDHLVPDGILDRFTVIPNILSVKIYDKLLKTFKACGYRPGLVQHCKAGDNVFVFYYDWRRDIVEQAKILHKRIETLKKVNGAPDLKVDLIAHSMGCLVAKYYLLYGDRDVLGMQPLPAPTYSGAKHVRKVVFVAPPFDGSTMALKYLHTGYKVGIQKISPQALFTMPSIFQLLPRNVRFFDENGELVAVDLYDHEIWRELRISIFSDKNWDGFLKECKAFYPSEWEQRSSLIRDQNLVYLELALNRSKQLHQALNYSDSGVPVLILASDRYSTLDAVTLLKKGNTTELSFAHHQKMEPGDKTVPLTSSLYGLSEGTEKIVLSGIHDKLPSEPEVMREIVHFLSR